MRKAIDLPHIKGEIEISDVVLQDAQVRAFFKRSDIEEAIDTNNFDYVYEKWIADIYFEVYLTELLLAAHIDPLEGLTVIPHYAFRDCASLTSITIPNSVTKIDKYAFLGCTSITSITIPESVTTIGDWAFGGCENLETIYCEAKKQPANWNKNWLGECVAKVIWGA